MNRKLKISTMVTVIATLGLSSQAWSGCNLDGSVTGASSVYDQSGQGNFSCFDLNFQYDITSVSTITLSPDGTTVVSVSAPDTGSGDPLIDKEIRAVVVKPSNGDRCVYNFPLVTFEAFQLTPDSDKPVSEVLVCSDGEQGIVEAVAEPQPTLPTTTAGTGCTGDIVVGGSSIFTDPTQEIAIYAENLQGDLVASCNQEDSTGTATTLAASSTSTPSQEYCEDRCVNFEDRGETAACLNSATSPLLPGEFSLDLCRPCDTTLQVIAFNETETDPLKRIPVPVDPETGDPMEFCWEKVNSACEGEDDLAGCAQGRTPGTMLKHSPVRQSDFQTTWYNRCRTSTITLNGIDYTTTTCK